MDTRKIAALIERHAEAAGWDVVETAGSGLSSSRYLTLRRATSWDADGDADAHEERRVRVSDHEARPTYERLHGSADIEIGDHAMATHATWAEAIARLAEIAGKPVPAAARRVLTAAKGREAAILERIRA